MDDTVDPRVLQLNDANIIRAASQDCRRLGQGTFDTAQQFPLVDAVNFACDAGVAPVQSLYDLDQLSAEEAALNEGTGRTQQQYLCPPSADPALWPLLAWNQALDGPWNHVQAVSNDILAPRSYRYDENFQGPDFTPRLGPAQATTTVSPPSRLDSQTAHQRPFHAQLAQDVLAEIGSWSGDNGLTLLDDSQSTDVYGGVDPWYFQDKPFAWYEGSSDEHNLYSIPNGVAPIMSNDPLYCSDQLISRRDSLVARNGDHFAAPTVYNGAFAAVVDGCEDSTTTRTCALGTLPCDRGALPSEMQQYNTETTVNIPQNWPVIDLDYNWIIDDDYPFTRPETYPLVDRDPTAWPLMAETILFHGNERASVLSDELRFYSRLVNMPFNPDLLGMSNPQESYQIQASQHSEDQVHQAPAKLPETHQGQNSDSLCIIPEFGPASAVPALATLRAGGRRGPLAKDKASMIAKTRREKKVCIRCKQNKVSCTGGGPCDRCRALAKATLWDQPCLKAHFADVIQSGTCNFISQRSVNYLTSDGSRRITTLLPETFELEKLLGLLKDRQGLFNIRTRQSSGPIYTLDLAGCYAFLARLKATHSLPDKSDLRDFIDRVLPRVSGWKRCVKGYDTSGDILTKLLRWNTVPSRASYDMIPITGGGPIVTMDIENPNHESDIYVAAQLSRIVCRSLEVQAFNTLQHRLNKQAWKEDPEEAKDFVKALGEILLTMRWRTPWWGTLGDGSNTDDIRKQRFIHRVQELTKILYFYFCNVKRKLPSFTDAKGLLGAEIEYKENVPEFDEFPSIDSTQGFETWMRQGRPVDWTRRLKVLRHGFRTLSVT